MASPFVLRKRSVNCSAKACTIDKTERVSENMLSGTDVEKGQDNGLENSPIAPSLKQRILSAFFYGISSLIIMVINKTVLTTYGFPSAQFLGLGQMAATVIVIFTARQSGLLTFQKFDFSVVKKVWPLPIVYLGNVIFGLSSTKLLSLPMLTVLRRFAILMTMLGELFVLRVYPRLTVQISVYSMIIGAIVAASNDLSFSLNGYVMVLLNDFFTAAYGVIMKQKLDLSDVGKYGLLFYNSLFMLPIAGVMSWLTGDFEVVFQFVGWNDPFFLLQFALSCVMGFILNYSVVLCTEYNSALTTMVIGCIKNISITYLGMLIGGDYIFSWVNFVGINISVISSLVYSWITFTEKPRPKVTAPSTTIV